MHCCGWDDVLCGLEGSSIVYICELWFAIAVWMDFVYGMNLLLWVFFWYFGFYGFSLT